MAVASLVSRRSGRPIKPSREISGVQVVKIKSPACSRLVGEDGGKGNQIGRGLDDEVTVWVTQDAELKGTIWCETERNQINRRAKGLA